MREVNECGDMSEWVSEMCLFNEFEMTECDE